MIMNACLTYEEQQLINAIQKVKMHPVNVLICVLHSFTEDNQDGMWNEKIETLDDYIVDLEKYSIMSHDDFHKEKNDGR